MNNRKILVTGGAGYIGTHCCVELMENGYDAICADNLNNSSRTAIERVEAITGKSLPFIEIDFCDAQKVKKLFQEHQFDGVIHFAGHKAVGESVEQPLRYYENNILSLTSLCQAMAESGCKNLVFSSSAAVYSTELPPPYSEDSPVGPSTPYGRTKVFIEAILRDLCTSDPTWNVSILRYFNPVGAHPSGLIGEDPSGIPNNLMPYIAQVAVGRLKELKVFGNDYNTPDGTCIRDFIHVVDLAQGHLAALRKLEDSAGFMLHNIGTGTGHSVLELIEAFKRVNKVEVPYVIAPRRPGDMAVNFASTSKAERELGWKSKLGLDEMVRDTWKWQTQNPNGFKDV